MEFVLCAFVSQHLDPTQVMDKGEASAAAEGT